MSTTEKIVESARATEHGFKDLKLLAEGLVSSGPPERAKKIALELLRSDFHQARCVGTFVLGQLAASDADALGILKEQVSQDKDWRVQEILAKAFDQFCSDTGYEAALPVIRDWLSAPSANIRRAVTEGLRIWTGRPYFREHPDLAIKLLSAFRADGSEYLRKSVGNALRDISKKHPELVRLETTSWDLEVPGVSQVYKLATRALV
ncbi:DNA alkylation repair protein [Plastorhodobacter daqingensis]|uniref:DNA alkylation repair protein n=1 Tax=Plastorhodobacter daqingensis TaxID=1387281 RepID=A0ABW2UL67_9RHOB